MSDSELHRGHRARMREKLIRHGREVFASYELLEMLLYYAVPCKNTNPAAKRLMLRFGDIEGVFSASEDELTSVAEVGQESAALIAEAANFKHLLDTENVTAAPFSDYKLVGEYVTAYFEKNPSADVIVISLDNSMRLISVTEISAADFSSGALKARLFLEAAVKSNASAAITAHNQRYGIAFPTVGVVQTVKMITSTFESIGVHHCEHYSVAGRRYLGLLSTDPASYLCGAGEAEYESPDDVLPSPIASGQEKCISSYLSKSRFAGDLEKLTSFFGSIEAALSAKFRELSALVGESFAVLFRLFSDLTSRRVTDSYKTGRVMGEEDILEYLFAAFLGASEERFYVMFFDENERFLGAEPLDSGVVNASGITPRRLLESAARSKAKSLIVAHNHPLGEAAASDEDAEFTRELEIIFGSYGISLRAHYIIAGKEYVRLDPSL